MVDHKAARDRCDAFIKDQTEEVRPEELPAQEECPICLNTYEEETPVRIKMDGCSHIIGRNCLSAILTNSPRLEKKCPLCRTKWMDAPASTVRDIAAVREMMARAGLPRNMGGYGLAFSPAPRPRPTSGTPRTGTVAPLIPGATNSQGHDRGRGVGEPPTPRRSSGRIINLIDSDEEEDVSTPVSKRVSYHIPFNVALESSLMFFAAPPELPLHHPRYQQCPRASAQHPVFT